MSATYQQLLEVGQRFESFVLSQFASRYGAILTPCHTIDSQRRYGDTVFGLEIKFDRKLHLTRNLCIETSSKKDRDQPTFSPDSIFSLSSAWLYGIGDTNEFYIFTTRALRTFAMSDQFAKYANETSRGFLIPRERARELAERVFIWDE